MSEKNNATCSICDSGYHLCMSCKDSIRLQPWKIHCCSADCYKVFQTIRGFSTGVYTKDEFKSKLKNIDLSNLDNYREHIRALIKDTLKEEPIVEDIAPVSRKRSYKVAKEEVKDDVDNAESIEDEIEAEIGEAE